jgi:hypothetical protein
MDQKFPTICQNPAFFFVKPITPLETTAEACPKGARMASVNCRRVAITIIKKMGKKIRSLYSREKKLRRF